MEAVIYRTNVYVEGEKPMDGNEKEVALCRVTNEAESALARVVTGGICAGILIITGSILAGSIYANWADLQKAKYSESSKKEEAAKAMWEHMGCK